MPLMLLSNPGLSLAVLGNPRRKGWKPRGVSRKTFNAAVRRASARVGRTFKTRGRGRYKVEAFRGVLFRRNRQHLPGISWSGRKGYLSFSGRVRRAGERSYSRPHAFTNPRRSNTMRRRRNPNAISGYISAAKGAPKQVMALFTGPNKIKNIGFAAGGAVGTYLAGGYLSAKVIGPLLQRVPVINRVVASPMGARIVGGMIPFTVGFLASRFIKGDVGKALLVGGAAASILELVMPGKVGQLVARLPGVPALAAAAPSVAVPAVKGPTNGLDGYVSAPSYAGVGDADALAGYVSAPSYAGVGDDEDALAGYVSAPSYAGVGDEDDGVDGADDVMAGVDGYIDQAQAGYQSYLAA